MHTRFCSSNCAKRGRPRYAYRYNIQQLAHLLLATSHVGGGSTCTFPVYHQAPVVDMKPTLPLPTVALLFLLTARGARGQQCERWCSDLCVNIGNSATDCADCSESSGCYNGAPGYGHENGEENAACTSAGLLAIAGEGNCGIETANDPDFCNSACFSVLAPYMDRCQDELPFYATFMFSSAIGMLTECNGQTDGGSAGDDGNCDIGQMSVCQSDPPPDGGTLADICANSCVSAMMACKDDPTWQAMVGSESAENIQRLAPQCVTGDVGEFYNGITRHAVFLCFCRPSRGVPNSCPQATGSANI